MSSLRQIAFYGKGGIGKSTTSQNTLASDQTKQQDTVQTAQNSVDQANAALGNYNGSILLRSATTSLTVPFTFRTLSDATGNRGFGKLIGKQLELPACRGRLPRPGYQTIEGMKRLVRRCVVRSQDEEARQPSQSRRRRARPGGRDTRAPRARSGRARRRP